MRLVTIDDRGPAGRRAGLWTDRGIVDLPRARPDGPATVLGILAEGGLDALRDLDPSAVDADAVLPADTPLWAPVDRPGKILALGLNFRSHADENDKPLPELPIVFAKATTALNGPTRRILLPSGTDQVDWEVELCVVIGRTTRNVAEDEALEAVAGYTIMNDVSARDWQFAVSQWHRAKSADTFAPMGPALVTRDEAGDWRDLQLTCRVNGEQVQHAVAGEDIIFSPEHTISFLSQSMTLEPGDCISLGTPAGVGYYRRPQRFLAPGDVVECEISGLGTLRNEVAAG